MVRTSGVSRSAKATTLVALGVLVWSCTGKEANVKETGGANAAEVEAGVNAPAPTDAKAGLAAIDVCSLLTFDEIEQVTTIRPDAALSETMGRTLPGCSYTSERELYPVAHVGIQEGAHDSWDAWVAAMIASGWGDPSTDGERVDIGRFGHYRNGLLQVGTGDMILTVLVNSSGRKARGKEGVIELARHALTRLP
jgi:hypothetical protein